MKTPNHVWIEYPKQLEDKIKHGSLELDYVSDYQKNWNAILYGNIYSLPDRIDSNIQEELKIGDKIFFHYLSADEDEMLVENGKNYLKIPVHHIFCFVRDGQLTPFGGYVLAKSIFEGDVEEVEVDGKKIPAKVSASGLVTTINISFLQNLSKVVHIGNPLRGNEELGVVPGDTVVMESHSHNKYIIEGSEYFVFHQNDIVAKAEL